MCAPYQRESVHRYKLGLHSTNDCAQLRHSPALCLPMLHLERRYRITRLDPPVMVPASAVLDAALHQRLRGRHTHMAHGAWLIHTGLTLARMAAESVQINQFQSIAAS